MNFSDENATYYDVLELTSDATPQEIRSAYMRLKNAYSKENVAHYSLFSQNETESLIKRIEEAFLILSNPEKRKSYDRAQGLIAGEELGSDHKFRFGQTDPLAGSSAPVAPQLPAENTEAETLIRNQTEWTGAAFKKVRELRGVSLDDLSDFTRISKAYLIALEEEDQKRLPATVFVRGFVQLVARRLKVPHDVAAAQYIQRLKTIRGEK